MLNLERSIVVTLVGSNDMNFFHFFSVSPMKVLSAGMLLGLASLQPALAQAVNFETLVVSQTQTRASANGFTAGFFAMSNITSRDRHGNVCVGFADTNPDHILTLEEDFSALTVAVNSGGNDTTLLIQGPSDNTVRCGEDTSRTNPDALIADEDWTAGTYRIWVGAHHQGQRYNYTISVHP
jgi:hypothetical protein